MLPYSCSFATHVNFLENKHRRRKHEIVNGHCEAKLRLQYRPNPLQVVLIKWLCTGAPPVSSYRDPGMNFFHCPGLFTQFTTCLLLNPMLLPTQYPIPLNHAFSRSTTTQVGPGDMLFICDITEAMNGLQQFEFMQRNNYGQHINSSVLTNTTYYSEAQHVRSITGTVQPYFACHEQVRVVGQFCCVMLYLFGLISTT